jgi:CheY-like chemotaxis protein
LLERSGFRVFLAVNGLDGLEKFQTHRRDIEVVLTDMNMPEMDGAEFIIALRKIDPAQRIVILSGSMDTETFERPVPGPTIECLTKPPSPARLLDTIRKNLAANAA